VLPKIFVVSVLALPSLFAFAQQAQPGSPPVKVNVLNVCSPTGDEQKEIASALSKVPKQPNSYPTSRLRGEDQVFPTRLRFYRRRRQAALLSNH
jgi:hypothetical protein